MSDVEFKELIKKELKWWKWIIGIIVIVIIFSSNMLANKLFYEEDIQQLKKDVTQLSRTMEDVKYTLILISQATGVPIEKNPFKNE